MRGAARLTVLSDMASASSSEQPVPEMLRQISAWGLSDIDLKTVAGRNVADLADSQVEVLAHELDQSSVGVEAFSTLLFKQPVAGGIEVFKTDVDKLPRILEIARRLRPKKIRLLGADLPNRHQTTWSAPIGWSGIDVSA